MPIKFKSEKEIFEEEREKRNIAADLEGKIPEEKIRKVKKIIRKDNFQGLIEKTQSHYMDQISKLTDKEKEYPENWRGISQFHIGTKDHLSGSITLVGDNQKQNIMLGYIIRKTRDDTGNFYYQTDIQLNPPHPADKKYMCETIQGDFYLYKFVTKEKTFQMFSTEKLDLGDYYVWGTITELQDDVEIGKSAKIQKKLPLLFVHSAFSDENEIQDHEEFFELFEKYKLDEKKFIEWLYTNESGLINEFPKSFTYIHIANFLASKNDFNDFRLPVLMISGSGTGKTTATELVFNRMAEIGTYTDLSNSTMKGIVPSFKTNNEPKPGLMLTARRYAPVDEFFIGYANLDGNDKSKIMESQKNLLDYSKRGFLSGHGDFTGQMRADHIALTNPKSYANDMIQLSKHLEPENLTRYLIWYIPDSQRKFIKEKKKNKRLKGKFNQISDKDFRAGVDYLHTFNCKYDTDKIYKIYEIGENYLNSKNSSYQKIKTTYESRYLEHCNKLIDSLIKFRCWMTGDKSFTAKQEDYDLVKSLWFEMLENWGIGFNIIEYQSMTSQ